MHPKTTQKKYKHTLLITLAGMLFIPAHMVEVFWPIALLSFALFLYVLVNEENTKYRILLSLLYGFLFGGSACLVFWHTLPFDWLQFSKTAQVSLVGMYWFFASLAFGLPFALFGFVRFFRMPFWALLVVFPALLVLVSLASAYAFDFLTQSAESLRGVHFSGSNPAYFFVEHEFMRSIAPYGGVYLVTYVAGVMSVLVYGVFLFREQKKAQLYISLFMLVFCVSALFPILPFFGSNLNTEESITAGAVSYALPVGYGYGQGGEEELKGFVEWVFKEAQTLPLDILVFPENASVTPLIGKYPELNDSFPSAVVVSSHTEKTSSRAMRAYGTFFEKEGGVYTETPKRYLTPMGEYIPSFFLFLLSKTGNTPLIAQAQLRLGYIPGGKSIPHTDAYGITYGALHCSEMISLTLMREAVALGSAEVIVNPVSQAWFNGSFVYEKHYRRVAQMQAASVYRAVVVGANISPAYIINPDGSIEEKSAWPKEGENPALIVGEVYPQTLITPYARYGNAPILAVSFGILIVFLTYTLVTSRSFQNIRRNRALRTTSRADRHTRL